MVWRWFSGKGGGFLVNKLEMVGLLPYRIHDGRVLILSDIHAPFHDSEALALAYSISSEFKPTCLVLNGDIWDATPVSPYPKPPHMKMEARESLEKTVGVIAEILQNIGVSEAVFLEGNHELWWWKFLIRKAEELYDLPELSIPALLRLPETVTYIPHFFGHTKITRTVVPEVVAGSLHIVHGDCFRLSSSVINIARTICTRCGVPMLVGHWHVCQEYLQVEYDGAVRGSWAVGALCLPRVSYNASRVVQQGIGLVYVSGEEFEAVIVPFWRKGKRLSTFCLGRKFVS